MRLWLFTAVISAALLAPVLGAQQTDPNKHPQSIRKRERVQQKRIGAGVASGQLTPQEAKKLEQKEAQLHKEIHKDRRDGGGLTPQERRKIDRKQDRLSKEIYKEKHDAQTVPPKK